MLPVSTKDVIRFTPILDQIALLGKLQAQAETDEQRAAFADLIAKAQGEADATPQPVYLLAVPSYLQRAAWRRDVRAAGAMYPGDAELFRALRDDLRACAPANLDELLAVVDEAETASIGDVDPEAVERLGEIDRIARALGRRYAALEGDREFFLSVSPIIAARHFLLGWEGVKTADGTDASFERRGGLTTDETLQHLGERELRSVGAKIIGLMRVGKDQEKNFVSPSQSHDGRKPSPTETKLLTEANGTSSESGTGGTPGIC
ncbi:hypothetical protein TSH58p_22665 (plasmid) [Azospirillum sp. TSH58]|uniref:hypothetical protein n=1 Tax=Azospirillum sp. TSH58 TaxID=664962 RepID=UPI000D60197C|nr:hypothetical protein [Azospirillum sp. TSH58]AWJ86321.1 hypothetical protein TSH58p_22665 [Azospirillum sp. TSH58]PWC73429.1 hypothetical protein TSH58_04450 [Azospirillum sp. TSH58]